MEKYTATVLELSTYSKQLDEIYNHIDNLRYLEAITMCDRLIDQLTKILSHPNKELKQTLDKNLSRVYKLQQNSYFKWLIHDFDQFCHNQQAKKDLLKVLKQGTTKDCFSEAEKQYSQFLECFIQLLFSNSIERDALEEARTSFCDLYDEFVQHQHNLNQALVLLGLALIAAYEGDLRSTYQGLNHAANTYPPIHQLVKTIEYQLPYKMSSINKEQNLLINPLAKISFPAETASPLKLTP